MEAGQRKGGKGLKALEKDKSVLVAEAAWRESVPEKEI